MKHFLKNIAILLIIVMGSLISGCTQEINSPPLPSPIHAIRFTDNNDFQFESPEEIMVSGQEQTVTLSIKSISIKPDSYIMDRPDKLMFTAKPIQEGQSYDFFDVMELQDNGESVIKVSLKPNDSNEVRGVSVNIYCKLPGIEDYLYGWVYIIQQPKEEEAIL